MYFNLTCSPAAQQTFSHLECVCESVCVSVCVCLPPAPSVSVSAADCGSPAAPAKHHGIQEGTAVRRKWDQWGWLLRVTIDNKQEQEEQQQQQQQQQVRISQVIKASSVPSLRLIKKMDDWFNGKYLSEEKDTTI